MDADTPRILSDAIVIGAGVSGLATAKCLKEAGHKVLLLEKSSDIGGVWNFKEDEEGGVMSFTRSSVSKQNYAFSDYPFPDDAPDFPHHSVVKNYINNYSKHNALDKITRFNLEVINIERKEDMWEITARKTDVPESETGEMEPEDNFEQEKKTNQKTEAIKDESNVEPIKAGEAVKDDITDVEANKDGDQDKAEEKANTNKDIMEDKDQTSKMKLSISKEGITVTKEEKESKSSEQPTPDSEIKEKEDQSQSDAEKTETGEKSKSDSETKEKEEIEKESDKKDDTTDVKQEEATRVDPDPTKEATKSDEEETLKQETIEDKPEETEKETVDAKLAVPKKEKPEQTVEDVGATETQSVEAEKKDDEKPVETNEKPVDEKVQENKEKLTKGDLEARIPNEVNTEKCEKIPNEPAPQKDAKKEEGKQATNNLVVLLCKYVAVSTGHHSFPNLPKFAGQDQYQGDIIHTNKYKDTKINNLSGKKLLVVGVGNSGVDVATNAATEGGCSPVYVSSRSGTWIYPNYIFGYPVDQINCRLLLSLPFSIRNWVMETLLNWVQGSPKTLGLNPKMRALQTVPTINSNIVSLIQRGDIKMVPNIQAFEGKSVRFHDGTVYEPDAVIMASGHKIDLPFLKEDLRKKVLVDPDNNDLRLYKNVFVPDIGHSLAFIGFVTPAASGSGLSMAEVQARWFAELTKGDLSLPGERVMNRIIHRDIQENRETYWPSPRNSLMREPITYNDEITEKFGAAPSVLKHPALASSLLLGSGGASQWRLDGPGAWSGADKEISATPVASIMKWALIGIASLLLMFFCWCAVWFVILDDIFDWDIID